MKKYLLLVILVTFLFIPRSVFARIGVGVATGKIVVNEKLKPGIIYTLPPLTVINTGDIPSDYEVETTYFETQKQMKPPNNWFIFSPHHFHLQPGRVQTVTIKLNLPLRVTPGDYFGFLEAHPMQKSKAGLTTVGIAAATKLYFSVVPANIFSAIWYKILSFWEVYAPWPQRVLLGLALLVILFLFKKFFNIQINIKKPKSSHSRSEEKNIVRTKEGNNENE